MAGSYNHVVKKDGSLLKPDRALGMLETSSGDVWECVEEMYGMIWYLADRYNDAVGILGDMESIKEIVEDARQNYKDGLQLSPTKRYKE